MKRPQTAAQLHAVHDQYMTRGALMFWLLALAGLAYLFGVLPFWPVLACGALMLAFWAAAKVARYAAEDGEDS